MLLALHTLTGPAPSGCGSTALFRSWWEGCIPSQVGRAEGAWPGQSHLQIVPCEWQVYPDTTLAANRLWDQSSTHPSPGSPTTSLFCVRHERKNSGARKGISDKKKTSQLSWHWVCPEATALIYFFKHLSLCLQLIYDYLQILFWPLGNSEKYENLSFWSVLFKKYTEYYL